MICVRGIPVSTKDDLDIDDEIVVFICTNYQGFLTG